MYHLHQDSVFSYKWLLCIQNILNSTGFNDIWSFQLVSTVSRQSFKNIIKQRLHDQFIQKWFHDIEISSRGQAYLLYKSQFSFEPYLLKLNCTERNYLCKFRTSNLKLPIETGRWNNVPREDRICPFCTNCIGDEFHYLYQCNNESGLALRQTYIPRYYYVNPNYVKMKGMFTICNTVLLSKVSRFLQRLIKLLNIHV